MQIDSSQIYLLIFRSRIDSNSYSQQFHFIYIISICKYINLTNIIPIFFKVFMNIIYFYWIYIKSMHISHYGFVCPVNFSNEKYIRVKKKKFLDIILREKVDIRSLWIICEYFPSDKYYSYSYSQVLEFTNYSYSYSYRSWLRQSILIPIRGKNYYSLITATYGNGWFRCGHFLCLCKRSKSLQISNVVTWQFVTIKVFKSFG